MRRALIGSLIALAACGQLPSSVKIECHAAKPDTLVFGGFIVTSPDTGQVCRPN